MRFILTGFTEEMGFRVFAFEGIDEDRTRTSFTVSADLALIRRYGIPIQELPLLCRSLLDRSEAGGETHTLTYTEEEMVVRANERAADRDKAAHKKKPPLGSPGDIGAPPQQGTSVPVAPRHIGYLVAGSRA